MKILIFSNFFPPEIGAAPMRLGDHARIWTNMGHDVTVVTNFPNSPYGQIYSGYQNEFYQKENLNGVKVRRVFTFPSGKMKSKLNRVTSFVVNMLMSIIIGLKCSKPDIIVGSAPYLAGLPALIVAFVYRKPMIYEMRDPWVQVGAETGIIKKEGIIHKFLRGYEKFLIRNASKVVVIGDEMSQYIQNDMSLTTRPSVIHNGIKIDDSSDKTEVINMPQFNNKFIIGLIGNAGNQYDFDVVLNTAESLKNSRCYFFFLGEGKQKEILQEQVLRRQLNNVGFFPAVPEKEVKGWFALCDVTIVSMKKDPIFNVYLPLKVLESLAQGVPVFFGGAGEVERILLQCNAGQVFPAGDHKILVEYIQQRIDNPAQLKEESLRGANFVRKHFSREQIARKYLKLMHETINSTIKL